VFPQFNGDSSVRLVTCCALGSSDFITKSITRRSRAEVDFPASAHEVFGPRIVPSGKPGTDFRRTSW